MTFKEEVEQQLNNSLLEKPSLFLIDISISDSYKIVVTLDGDNGVTLQDCIDVTRAIEGNLDREAQDYALEVASVGVGSPLKLVRQYIKNIGRELDVVLQNGTKFCGEIVEVTENTVILCHREMKKLEVKKKKELVEEKYDLAFSDIKEAKIVISFK